MAKLSTKTKVKPAVPETKEEKAQYVKNTVFGDVGIIKRKFGHYDVATFKVKGDVAVTITDTMVVITKEEYDSTTEDDIIPKIIDIYKGGRPVDDWSLGTVTKRDDNGAISVVSGKPSPILKDKVEKKMIDLGTDKASIRATINAKTVDQIQSLCSKLHIETSKYKHLSGGLLKMSLVNVALGKITNYLSTGVWDLDKMKEELK